MFSAFFGMPESCRRGCISITARTARGDKQDGFEFLAQDVNSELSRFVAQSCPVLWPVLWPKTTEAMQSEKDTNAAPLNSHLRKRFIGENCTAPDI
jgi:hypothetical protein